MNKDKYIDWVADNGTVLENKFAEKYIDMFASFCEEEFENSERGNS